MSSPKSSSVSLVEAIVVLNVYGNLVGIGALVALSSGWVLGPWLGLAPGCVGLWMLWWSASISRRLPSKVRLASALIRRTERSGYRPSNFKSTCQDPCMRVLTRLVHAKCGRSSEATAVIARYRNADSFAFVASSEQLNLLLETGAVTESAIQDAIRKALAAAAEPPT